MIMTAKILSVFACSVLPWHLSLAQLPEAEVTAHVSDSDTSVPIEGVDVGITFTIGNGHGGTTSLPRRGLTGATGSFTAVERTLPDIAVSARKDNYYVSAVHYNLRLTMGQLYEPRNVTIPIILKRIGHPVAMYARKRIQLELPVLDKPVGYDLIAADWVTPYGKGSFGDFIFTGSRGEDVESANVIITFSDPQDGIRSIEAEPYEGSALKLPRAAPDDGYQARLRLDMSTDSTGSAKRRNYFYRVRSVTENGRLVKAMYGKVHGEIEIDTINSKTALVFLTYYLNPDGTRNVEFDPNKNLFKDLPSLEQVIDP